MRGLQDKLTSEKKLTNPVKAIRAFCLDCCGGSTSEVKLCTSIKCVLYPFRLGKNPYRTRREMTDEQKAAAAERFRVMREKRQEDPDDEEES